MLGRLWVKGEWNKWRRIVGLRFRRRVWLFIDGLVRVRLVLGIGVLFKEGIVCLINGILI